MIVTCPSCATRHEFANALRAPGDVKITCRNCGHRWIEIDADAAIDIESFRRLPASRTIEPEYEPEEEVQHLMSAAREARATFAEARKAKSRKLRSWASYALFLATPFVGAALFPEVVVSAAPIAVKAYEKLGVDVNIYGLEIKRVEQQHATVKGTRVLSIKGEIVNTTSDMKKIPWLRFALQDANAKEVYTWNLDTASRPLRPGETTTFVTRVQAPPEASQNLQIRFAKAQEIGSNAAP